MVAGANIKILICFVDPISRNQVNDVVLACELRRSSNKALVAGLELQPVLLAIKYQFPLILRDVLGRKVRNEHFLKPSIIVCGFSEIFDGFKYTCQLFFGNFMHVCKHVNLFL